MITIKCVYFKESGKHYSHGIESFKEDLFDGCIYPKDYGEKLRELKKLPGLEQGYWEGYFTVEPMIPTGYCELVLKRPL